MQFSLLGLSAIALVAAGPLASRFSNETSTVQLSSLSSAPASVGRSTSINSGVVSSVVARISAQSQSAPTTVSAPYATINGTSGTTIVKPEHVTKTVYQPEIIVTVINQVTCIATVYNVPVTTAVGAVIETIYPQPQVTSTKTSGTETIVVIQASTQRPIPTITSTIVLGSVVSTVLVVPSPGPASTQGGPAPTASAASTYTYTALNNICECPLPSTVTQYITVLPSSQAASTPAAQTSSTGHTASAPANCAAPATAASPTLFPGLIIPVQAANPTKSYGTQYSAAITAEQEVVFQFNVGSTGKCSLNLALPPKDQLTTSSWAVTGDGVFSVAKLPSSVTESVNYAQLPTSLSYTQFTAVQGGTVVASEFFDCVAGTTATFVVRSINGATAQFFEDYNCPYVGLSLVQA